METESLTTKVYKKMFAEQEAYREWLITQPPEDILYHSYEYRAREDILCALENDDLTDEQATALLSLDTPLADVFHDFEYAETNYMESVWESIVDTADAEIKRTFDYLTVPLYIKPLYYAANNLELEQYNKSYEATIDCREFLQNELDRILLEDTAAIGPAMKSTMNKFGRDRLEFVLASTVATRTSTDESVTDDSRRWAEEVVGACAETAFERDRLRAFSLQGFYYQEIGTIVNEGRKQIAADRAQSEKKPSVLDKLRQHPHTTTTPKKTNLMEER